jgi:hypothetical protein
VVSQTGRVRTAGPDVVLALPDRDILAAGPSAIGTPVASAIVGAVVGSIVLSLVSTIAGMVVPGG